MRVLLVLHSAATRTVLRRRLAHLDLPLVVVDASVEDAHTAARAGSVDLVILDAPDGRAPLRALAQLQMADPALLVAVAAWGPTAAEGEAVVLPAPFEPEALRGLLQRAAALRGLGYDEPGRSLPA